MSNELQLPTPAEIRAYLDEYVIGQDEAKKVLSVAVYNHYKRTRFNAVMAQEGGAKLAKSNVMMIGPTGSGKTYITSTLAKVLNVPFAAADATTFVAGSIVKSVENILLNLIQSNNYDVKRVESSIIYIDEIDKIAKRGHNSAAGESIQQSLLKFIEGTVVSVPDSSQRQYIQIDTSNILFIVGGAFVGLDVIIQMRTGDSFTGLLNAEGILDRLTTEDIVRFGLIPEFVGRIPVVVRLNALDRQALIDALTKPKNSIIEQYKRMFAMDNVELVFDRQSLERIADKALALNTGARGLRTIVEETMVDIMYKVPNEKNLSTVTITSDVVDKKGTATFDYVEAREDQEVPNVSASPARTKYSE